MPSDANAGPFAFKEQEAAQRYPTGVISDHHVESSGSCGSSLGLFIVSVILIRQHMDGGLTSRIRLHCCR